MENNTKSPVPLRRYTPVYVFLISLISILLLWVVHLWRYFEFDANFEHKIFFLYASEIPWFCLFLPLGAALMIVPLKISQRENYSHKSSLMFGIGSILVIVVGSTMILLHNDVQLLRHVRFEQHVYYVGSYEPPDETVSFQVYECDRYGIFCRHVYACPVEKLKRPAVEINEDTIHMIVDDETVCIFHPKD